jgi:hypothetical protein
MQLDKQYGYGIAALAKTSEPIRTNKWLVNFNFNELSNSSVYSNKMLSFHVKSADVPEFNTESDSMFYFGVERKVTTSVSNAGSTSITILEGENLVGYSTFVQWIQDCVNINQISNTPDILLSTGSNKQAINGITFDGRLVNRNIMSLDCYSSVTGNVLFTIKYTNIKPTKVSSVKLSYESTELYKYDVSFEYDLATLVKPTKATKVNRISQDAGITL